LINEDVATLEVGQFVQENVAQLGRREASRNAFGQ